ncbi:sodium/proton-translocating pyrophosphatase [Candidatus Saccharibacteria bacterium]|nr:sodium/proton-translocating pyrophosphatase [Candidatus Saccharibacteria bacterium]
MFYAVILLILFATFVVIWYNFVDLRNHKEGTAEMKELAAIIREGAKTFMNREHTVIIPTILVVSAIYSLFMEKYCGLSLIFGSALSLVAVNVSMRGGTYANVRTANAARKTGAMSRTIRIALMGGSISGFSV